MKRLCLFLLLPLTALAGEPEAIALLRDLRPADGAAEFRYEETRVLELVAEPWHGSGFLLSGADGSLVKLQLSPQRVVMAVADGRMWYYDPAKDERHNASLDSDGAVQRQISAFRAILQGRAEELRTLYRLDAERKQGRWTLRLAGKEADAVAAIEMSGEDRGPHRTLRIHDADGESTDYRLEKTAGGEAVETKLRGLLREATGEPGEQGE